MDNPNLTINDDFIRSLENESKSVFIKYNKVILKDFQKWKDFFSIYNKFALKLEKPIDVIIKNPFLVFHSQGMRIVEQDKIIIKIWGIHPPHLIHELVHCYFPSKNKSLHEGFN